MNTKFTNNLCSDSTYLLLMIQLIQLLILVSPKYNMQVASSIFLLLSFGHTLKHKSLATFVHAGTYTVQNC